MSPLAISVVIFLVTVVMFFTGKVSLGLIGIGASVLLQITGVLPAETVWGNFTNSSVVMFAALFVLSAGLMKTSMVDNFVDKLAAVEGNQRKVLWSCLFISILMSIFMNSTAAVAAMTPVILYICERSQVNARKILKPCCDTANMWTGSLPVGMGASGYLTTNMMIKEMGGTVEMGILDNAIIKVPVLIVVTLFYFFLADKFLPDTPLSTLVNSDSSASVKKGAQLTPAKEKMTYAIFAVTVACMLCGGIFGWSTPTYIFPVIGSIAMVVCGILKPNEASKKIPVSMMLLVGGMLNVASGLGSTGGAKLIGDAMANMLGGSKNTYLILSVLFLIPAICTQFMNNIAVNNAFKPLALATCISAGVDPRLGSAAAAFAATMSILTPMASAPQAMIMGPGEYKFMDYVKCAIIPSLIYFVVLIVWTPIAGKLLWGI